MLHYRFRRSLIGLVILVWILQSCLDNETKIGVGDMPVRTIDLFPQERTIHDTLEKLSLDQAFQISEEVLLVTYIKKIDSSHTRGVNPFYIYEVSAGSFEKSADTTKNRFPILFLSNQRLFKGNVSDDDSVYLFLQPIGQYYFLQQNMGIKYKWVNNAPFVKYKEK